MRSRSTAGCSRVRPLTEPRVHPAVRPERAAVSPAALSAALADALRQAGIAVVPGQAQRLAAALPLLRWQHRDELYWAARVTLVSAADDLATFDAVFVDLIDGLLDPAGRRGDPTTEPLDLPPVRRRRTEGRQPAGHDPEGSTAATASSAPAVSDDIADDSDATREAALAAMSPEERLGERDFAGLSDEELADLRGLVERIRLITPVRRSRRTRPRARGRDVDMRRTLRLAGRSGGEAVRIARRERRDRARRLVLLCDVSGSMEPYTRVFLGLLQGAVSSTRAEAFVFATRLTRVTDDLRVNDPDVALAQAAARATDMAGGTRLGESLRTFLDRYGRRGVARGAVLVILSDGWTGDAEVVAEQMARLGRLCHRIVWVNPRKAAPGYEPLAMGMAAGLPYCDSFVSGHTLHSLGDVVLAVGGGAEATPSRARRGDLP